MEINSAILSTPFLTSANQNRRNVYYSNFASNNKPYSKEKQQRDTLLWSGIALGSAIALFIIGKKEIPMLKLKSQIKKSYNKIWEDVLKTIDQSKIQIEKPKLKMFSDTKGPTQFEYSIADNSIGVNLNTIKNNGYIAYNLEKKLAVSAGAYPLMTLDEINMLKKQGTIDATWIVKKVNEQEKMLAINYALAHEQRHCVQKHYILNDANYGAKSILENAVIKLKKSNQNLSEEKLMEKAKKICPYVVNFKPKGEYKDLVLLSTYTYNDKRIGYATKHLVRNDLEYTSTDIEKYNLNTFEIDANTFAESYLKTYKKLQKGCDDFVVKFITNMTKKLNTKNISKFLDINKQYVA